MAVSRRTILPSPARSSLFNTTPPCYLAAAGRRIAMSDLARWGCGPVVRDRARRAGAALRAADAAALAARRRGDGGRDPRRPAGLWAPAAAVALHRRARPGLRHRARPGRADHRHPAGLRDRRE